MSQASTPVPRPAARVVLLDPDDRLLLIRFQDEQRGAVWWATPGGGLRSGETYEQTAVRETREETGLVGIELGPWVWTRHDVYPARGVLYAQEERFFEVRVPSFEVDHGGLEADEREFVRAFRWWTLAELEATTEELAPGNLARLVGDLIRLGPPSTPIEVGR